jgi:hypothetical protein
MSQRFAASGRRARVGLILMFAAAAGIVAAGIVSVQAQAPAAKAAAQKKAAAPPPAPPLDLNNPDDAVKVSRKIQSALEDGKPTVYWFQGNVYSRIPGERDRLLFTYQAFNIRASKQLVEPGRGYGFRHVSREILLYLDPKTKEVLRTWKNPWTGKEVEVVHVANDPVNSRGTFAQGQAGPFRLDATFKEGLGIYQVEVPLWYTNPLGGEYQQYVGGDYQCIELFTFYFNEKQMLDSAVPDAPDINVAWSRVSQFLPWMEMGGRVGYMIFSGAGKKVAGFDALPDVLKNEVAARYPEYRTPPALDDARPNETSWTYFKKVIDKKRASTPK